MVVESARLLADRVVVVVGEGEESQRRVIAAFVWQSVLRKGGSIMNMSIVAFRDAVWHVNFIFSFPFSITTI